MNHKVVDRDNWRRKEYFEHYLSSVPCAYSMTVTLDITKIMDKKWKLYPAMLYYLTRLVNQYEEFRTAFRKDGQLVIYEEMHPCYTVFHKDSQTFSNLWTEYSDDYTVFSQRYEEDLREYGGIHKMNPKPNLPENSFTVSMIPWTTFESFHLHVKDDNYLIPIFTIGKYEIKGGKYLIPLAVQVHHAVCDGFHLCRFLNGLQSAIDEEAPANPTIYGKDEKNELA